MNNNNQNYQDKVVVCKSCGQKFAWTAGEQKFYDEKELQSPTHCRICRAALEEAKKDKFRGKLAIIETEED